MFLLNQRENNNVIVNTQWWAFSAVNFQTAWLVSVLFLEAVYLQGLPVRADIRERRVSLELEI